MFCAALLALLAACSQPPAVPLAEPVPPPPPPVAEQPPVVPAPVGVDHVSLQTSAGGVLLTAVYHATVMFQVGDNATSTSEPAEARSL